MDPVKWYPRVVPVSRAAFAARAQKRRKPENPAISEPGTPYKRGAGRSRGRIMEAFGDRPVDEVTMKEVSQFLRGLDSDGLTLRNVNKYRQVLQAMFTYACRSDTYELPSNPVDRTDKRREPPLGALNYYESRRSRRSPGRVRPGPTAVPLRSPTRSWLRGRPRTAKTPKRSEFSSTPGSASANC